MDKKGEMGRRFILAKNGQVRKLNASDGMMILSRHYVALHQITSHPITSNDIISHHTTSYHHMIDTHGHTHVRTYVPECSGVLEWLLKICRAFVAPGPSRKSLSSSCSK